MAAGDYSGGQGLLELSGDGCRHPLVHGFLGQVPEPGRGNRRPRHAVDFFRVFGLDEARFEVSTSLLMTKSTTFHIAEG